MSAYYGQPVKYFTDEISEDQFTMLAECMAEVLSQGEYEAGQDPDKPDLEAFRRQYGNRKEVRV
jgi:hypothetical protein